MCALHTARGSSQTNREPGGRERKMVRRKCNNFKKKEKNGVQFKPEHQYPTRTHDRTELTHLLYFCYTLYVFTLVVRGPPTTYSSGSGVPLWGSLADEEPQEPPDSLCAFVSPAPPTSSSLWSLYFNPFLELIRSRSFGDVFAFSSFLKRKNKDSSLKL